MDSQIVCDHKIRGWTLIKILFVSFILAKEILLTEGKICVKREEIGNREGNLYNCEDLVLSECCERNRSFTCCEPRWKHTMKDQLWILFAVAAIALLMCVIVAWCSGQSEFFRSPTAKDAAKNWKDKFVHMFDTIKGVKSGSVGTLPCNETSYTPLISSSQFMGSQRELV